MQSKPRKKTTKWKPKLDRQQCLIGPLPAVLDLRTHSLATKIFIHDWETHTKAEAEGRPVQPNLFVADDENLETLYFPADDIGVDYAVIENLPNLKELYVCGKEEDHVWHRSHVLQWLICRNLPNLRRVTVQCEILVWLDLLDLDSVETVVVTKSPMLDHFRIEGVPKLKSVQVGGCVKLREIKGMSAADHDRLQITRQIQRMQAKSRRNRKIYSNMTYTDVDLMRPLEWVYTGGTGETYAYDAQNWRYDWKDGKPWCVLSMGCSSQESCLEQLIDFGGNFLRIPTCTDPGREQILKFFAKSADTVPLDFWRTRTVYADAKALSAKERVEYEKRLKPFNYSFVAKRTAEVDLWVVYDIDDERRHRACRGRNVLVNDLDLRNFVDDLEQMNLLKTFAGR